MYLASTDAANALLADDPLALLIGMLLDQQVPMEKAFTSPDVLRERLGERLDLHEIARYDAEAFEQIFRTPPALHRFPAAMARRVQTLAQQIIDEFDADPSSVWTGAANGSDLVARLSTLPGYGKQKAKIFAALLGKQLDVRPDGWREATGELGTDGVHLSVADIVDAESLQAVREHKKAMKAAAKAARD